VKESLSDRLSYLIGESREEREAIRKDFGNYYVTRSKIVHGKQPNLGHDQSQLKDFGRYALERALKRELDLLL
jgi:hypothetical protein